MVKFMANHDNNGMIYVEEAEMYNNENSHRTLHWSKAYRSFKHHMIRIPSDRLFSCEEVTFNFKHDIQNRPGGLFRAKNFYIGFYLDDNYSLATIEVFNPCSFLSGCSNGKCNCELIDDNLKCNGLPVDYEDIYGTGISTLSLDTGSMARATVESNAHRAGGIIEFQLIAVLVLLVSVFRLL